MGGSELIAVRQTAKEKILRSIMKFFFHLSARLVCCVFLIFVSLGEVRSDTFYVESPSVICKAHFKSGFSEFFSAKGDGFLFEFNAEKNELKNRWGYSYNGIIMGADASMLLNWPENSEVGIITVLDAEYPCRAFYSSDNFHVVSDISEEAVPPAKAEFSPEQPSAVEATLMELTVGESTLTTQSDTITQDKIQSRPEIVITSVSSKGPRGVVIGRVVSSAGMDVLLVDGQEVPFDADGNFRTQAYVPEGGINIEIDAFDVKGASSSSVVTFQRAITESATPQFDRLNPLKRIGKDNDNAVALIIGVADYKETNAKAIYADGDATVFYDYASEKLGVPQHRIQKLINDSADEKEVLLAVKRWLARVVVSEKTDVYVFFAGHGLASDDGSEMYLLPYDGSPELLEKTAILRKELFADIASTNARSVTVFLDTCYSGTTRGTDMLIASRPIAIRALEQSIPDNFTVMTAAAGDQTAKPLEEAKHGMFSYFLMKGMEGEADANQDNKITAGELHQYVQTNVVQQSSGSQTPELQGDADRVLVRFQ